MGRNEIPHKKGHSCSDHAVEVGHNDFECQKCGKKVSSYLVRRK